MKNESEELNQDTVENRQELLKTYPAILERVKALVVDWLIVLMMFIAVANTFEQFENVSPMVKGIAFFVIFGLYDPLMISFTKGTIGHKAMGLQVVHFENHQNSLSVAASVLRSIIKGLLGWISFLSVISNEEKRAVHDTATNSVVIHVPRKKRNRK